jgi:hypothetical protein
MLSEFRLQKLSLAVLDIMRSRTETGLTIVKNSADRAGFVGFFCWLSEKGLCLLICREERHAKH